MNNNRLFIAHPLYSSTSSWFHLGGLLLVATTTCFCKSYFFGRMFSLLHAEDIIGLNFSHIGCCFTCSLKVRHLINYWNDQQVDSWMIRWCQKCFWFQFPWPDFPQFSIKLPRYACSSTEVNKNRDKRQELRGCSYLV